MRDTGKIEEAQEAWQNAVRAGEESAAASAQTAIAGCRDALIVLTDNLEKMGYPVKSYFQPCSSLLDARLDTLGKAVGEPVPPILIHFWQTIGGVSLVDLDDYSHTDFWDEQGVYNSANFCDGLHIDSYASEDWIRYATETLVEEWRDNHQEFPEEQFPYILELSPDGYHKDNISGGAPYGVSLGGTWVPIWEGFAWAGPKRPQTAPDDPCDFLSYLRTTILECAGFPGLYGVPEFEPIRERLLAGVPIF